MARSPAPTLRAGLALLLVAGCAIQAPPTKPAASGGRPAAGRSAAPARKPAPSPALGSAVPSTPASAARASAGGPLRRPAGATVVVAGRVALDPAYVVSNNGGSLVSNNGGAVLAAGRTRVEGGRLVSDAGGGLIANDGGNIISDNGGGIISDNGGGIISDNGGGIISDNGGGLISDKGGAIAPRPWRLAQAAPSGLVPAAGMTVGVRSLRTGARLPVGVDDAGNPVYAVFSNLAGGFELFVPEAEAGNVLVVAGVPETTDPRQAYDAIATTGAVDQRVDDDTAVVTRFIRSVMVRRFADFMTLPPDVTRLAIQEHYDGTLEADALTAVDQVHAAAVGAGVTADEGQQAAVWALAATCADDVLAGLDLDGVQLDHRLNRAWPSCLPAETVRQALVLVIRQAREGAAARLAADPAHFEKQAYLQLANACKPGTYAIKRPSDLPAFFVDEYLAPSRFDAFDWQDVVLEDVGATYGAEGAENDTRLSVASRALIAAFARDFGADAGGLRDRLLGRIARFRADAPVPAGAPAPAPPPCPLPEASELPEPAPGERGRPLVVPSCPPPVPTAADGATAAAIYRDVLGREPSAEEGAAMAQDVANGVSMARLRRRTARTPEGRQLIKEAHLAILGRKATSEDVVAWIARIAEGATAAALRAELAKRAPA